MTKIEEIQAIIGTPVDGKWGPKSQAALDAIIRPGDALPVPTQDWVDDRSEKAIGTLHRLVQPKARQLVRLAAAKGITIKITSGTRTYAEQDKLFAQGGVTKARAGQSNHNFGLAFDVTIFSGAAPVWESPRYAIVGSIGRGLGLTWGGDWKSFKDEPHFELHPPWAEGMTYEQMMSELRRRHDNGVDVFA